MKHIVLSRTLLTLSLIALLLVLSSVYGEAVKIGSYNVTVNETIKIPVTVINGVNIAGAVIKIEYDPALVQVLSVEPGDFETLVYNISNDRLVIAVVSSTACGKSNCTIAYIVFKGLTTGCTDLKITYAEIASIEGKTTHPDIINGKLCITSRHAVRTTSAVRTGKSNTQQARIAQLNLTALLTAAVVVAITVTALGLLVYLRARRGRK